MNLDELAGMNIDLGEFLVDWLDEPSYGPPYFLFWVRVVIEGMALLGPETEDQLERLCRLLLDYQSGASVDEAAIKNMRDEIYQPGGAVWGNTRTPLSLKYQALNAIAVTDQQKLADLYTWQYGVVTALDRLTEGGILDQTIIDLIRRSAAEQGVTLVIRTQEEVNQMFFRQLDRRGE